MAIARQEDQTSRGLPVIEIGAQHDARETNRAALGRRFQQIRHESEELASRLTSGIWRTSC